MCWNEFSMLLFGHGSGRISGLRVIDLVVGGEDAAAIVVVVVVLVGILNS